jgi:hypothetical protein
MALHEAMPPDSVLGPVEPLLECHESCSFLGHLRQDLARLDSGP